MTEQEKKRIERGVEVVFTAAMMYALGVTTFIVALAALAS